MRYGHGGDDGPGAKELQLRTRVRPPPAAKRRARLSSSRPGSAIVLNTGADKPVQYKLSKGVTYMNARGKVVKAGKMKKDRKVRVHYEKEGNDMVVDKISVVKD